MLGLTFASRVLGGCKRAFGCCDKGISTYGLFRESNAR
jgi:hypothetical protein